MKSSVGHKASVLLAVGFALWLGWQWLDVPETEKKLLAKRPLIEETIVAPSPAPAAPSQSLTLPAPPPPPPSGPKPVAKPQAHPPQQEPQVKPEQPPATPAEKTAEPVKPVPAEKPVKAVMQKVEPKTPAAVIEKAQPAPKPAPRETTIKVTHAQTATGRALLRVLEYGKGPQVEIAWPQRAQARDRLFDRLQRCFGMENAVMDGQGNLYRGEEPRGVRWEINLDRYSGFLRQAAGRLPSAEQRLRRKIIAHHGTGRGAALVRIFPRRVDASLLGGLRAVLGGNYQASSSIQARYDLQDGAVVVRDIRVNGRRVDGVIALAAYRRCGRRA